MHLLKRMKLIQNHREERFPHRTLKQKRVDARFPAVGMVVEFGAVLQTLLEGGTVPFKNPSVLDWFHSKVDFSYILVYN